MNFDLETARLGLKPVKSSDFEVFYNILTDGFVRKYLCDDEILPRVRIGHAQRPSGFGMAKRTMSPSATPRNLAIASHSMGTSPLA